MSKIPTSGRGPDPLIARIQTIITTIHNLDSGDHFLHWGNRWVVSDIDDGPGYKVCINTSTGHARGFDNSQRVEKIV